MHFNKWRILNKLEKTKLVIALQVLKLLKVMEVYINKL